MITINSKSTVFLFLLVAFLLECAHGRHGCTLNMRFERLDEEDVDVESMTRKEHRRYKRCTRGKLRRYFGILNRVAKKHGWPTADMTGIDHSIEKCDDSEWPFEEGVENFAECKNDRYLEEDDERDEFQRELDEEEFGGTEFVVPPSDGFLEAMEGGRRKLQDFCCGGCSGCCVWCGQIPGYGCCNYYRRRLGESVATKPQDHRDLMSNSTLAELKQLKTQITLNLMDLCDKANLPCFNCTAPIVELVCPITNDDEESI